MPRLGKGKPAKGKHPAKEKYTKKEKALLVIEDDEAEAMQESATTTPEKTIPVAVVATAFSDGICNAKLKGLTVLTPYRTAETELLHDALELWEIEGVQMSAAMMYSKPSFMKKGGNRLL